MNELTALLPAFEVFLEFGVSRDCGWRCESGFSQVISNRSRRFCNRRNSLAWCLPRYLLILTFRIKDSAYRYVTVRFTSSMQRFLGGSPDRYNKFVKRVRCHLLWHSPPSCSKDFMGTSSYLSQVPALDIRELRSLIPLAKASQNAHQQIVFEIQR